MIEKQDLTFLIGDFISIIGKGRVDKLIENMISAKEMKEVKVWWKFARTLL